MDIILTLAAVVIGVLVQVLILFAVIQAAVRSALRVARREELVEKTDPDGATWLTERQRNAMKSLADRRTL